MLKLKNKLAFASILLASTLLGQKSLFNNLTVENKPDYQFIVSGHFHGSSNNTSSMPANTLMANMDWVNNSGASFTICLGDLFKDIKKDIPNFQKYLFDRLQHPLFNSVGNHDVSDNVYQDNFGSTYLNFVTGKDMHIILDSELDNGSITGDQLSFLKSSVKEANLQNLNNVFVYAHRPIWAVGHPELDELFIDNTRATGGNNYRNDVLPILQTTQGNVFMFGGSLGVAPASFFYQNDATDDITYIASAIRELPRDAVLMVHVKQGNVSFTTHSFTTNKVEPLETYNLKYWQTHDGREPFNWKLIPLYIWNMIAHRYFWYGIIYSALGLCSFILWKKWRKKRRLKNSKTIC